MRRLAVGLLLLVAGCNRSRVADVTLDADATQRNATAAKTLSDLAAADAASRGPAPIVRDAPGVNTQDDADDDRSDARPVAEPAEEIAGDAAGAAPANGADAEPDER